MSHVATSRAARFADYLSEMKESGSVLKWVWDELVGAEGKKLLVRMFMVMVGSTLLLALQPLVFSSIINYVHDTHAKFLIAAVAALAATALLQHGVSFVQQIVREKAWNRTMFSMQTRLNELFYEKTLGQHLEEGSSLSYTTIDRAKGRIETIQQMLLFDTGGMVIQIFFSYLLLWVLSWKIGLVATILVCAHIAWSLYLNYHVSVETESIEQGFRAHGRQLIERWEKIARVKTSGKSASEHARLARWFDDVLGQDFRFWSWFIKQAMIRDGMILIARVVIVAYGAYLVYRGVWQVGTLIPLYAWITDLSLNLGWIGHAERRVNQQVPYIKALRNALEIVPAFSEEEGVAMKNVEPIKVEFCGIHLAYQEPGMPAYPILRDVSFVVRPGEKVALIGPSGAGKTSIMKLLLRFLDPSAGEIWVNGSRLADVRLASWMEHVGYIPQEAQVFDGTIRYNLTFGLSAERQALITDEEIWEVMRLLQIDFGGRLIHGLDTVVGKDGMKLSGGQKQRLMIGAAVIKKPIFMVIDEATASLDSSTERLVQEGLEKVLAGPTGALIVAHRLSTVRTICNRFIVLRPLEEVTEGLTQVEAEAGSFEELYVISPTFQRLANDQHIRL